MTRALSSWISVAISWRFHSVLSRRMVFFMKLGFASPLPRRSMKRSMQSSIS
uniref:Uncharacterized protein n=1 Tax=Arundo donax TaxID=35708 RepID=A0A0A9C0N2_ARUDO